MSNKTVNQKKSDRMLKIVALVCALFLWFYAEAQENPAKERQLTVPVQYVNLAADYVVESASQSVQITIKGNETDIMSLRSDDFTAAVDLSGAVVGSASYPVMVNSSAVNERFTYTPDKITVSIDQIQQKEVPIRVRTDGTVAQYYELSYTDVQPETVIVRGSGKHLSDITDVETDVIDISGMKQHTELQVMLNLPDGVVAQINEGEFTSHAQITVALHIQPSQSSRTLETMISLRNIPEGMQGIIEPDKATMVLTGDAELLATQPILDQLLLYVDCDGLAAGEYHLPVQVEASNGAVQKALQSVSVQTVTVRLMTEPERLPEAELPDDITEDNVNDTISNENKENNENNAAE